MDFREALARVRQRNAQSSRQKDREETEGKGAQPGAHEAERYGGSQMSFRDALARVREKNGTQTVPHTSEDPLTQLALQKIETEQQGTTWADVRELAQSRKQEQDQKRLQLGEELLHPEQRVQQDGMQSVPVGVVHATEPFRQQMQTETVRQQKYGGKSYGQIKELLAGMEAGEEKAWLENFAPSVMTAGDYDTEIADVSMELEGLERQRSQLYNAGGSDFFDKGELQEMDQLQDRIKTLSQKKAQLESSRKYGFLSENADYAEGSAYRPALYGQNSAYRIINGEGRQWGSVHESAKHMTQEEIANYNYIFHTEGEEAAKAYIRYLMPTLNSRKMEYVAANAKAVAEAYPALADFASISGTLLGGVGMLDALGQRIVKDVSGDYYTPIDTNSAAMVPSVMSSTIRGTRAQNLAEKHGTIHFDETEHPILSRLLNGKSWGDVYQLGMSMVDSTATAVLSPVLGPGATLLLGGSSATQTMLDAAANGASDEQALTMGALAGAFEYLFEKYELESLIGNIDDGILKALFKQSLSEGFGEGMTTIANYAADSLIMADKSELSRLTAEYMEKDPRLTEAQARKEALKDMAIQTGWDAVGGMATGGIMGGTGAGVNKVTSKLQQLAMEKVTADQEALRKLAIEKVQAEQQGQITENTAPEDGVKYSIKRTQNMSWEEQISGALSHSKNIARNDTLVLDDIPATLVNDGIESKKLAIPLSVITKAKSGKDASHSIKDENLRDLQRGVRNAPIMINNPARNAIVFVTDIKQDGAPILVAFQRNAQFDGDDVHKATSIHLQMDVASMLKALPADATVYAKNESELDATVGVADSLRSLAANIKFTGNTVTENVAGVNGEISSAEGQILRGSDAVQIAEVESAGGGKLTVKLSDGSTADASELSFSDVGEQELWRVIAQYADNAEAARQLLKEYRAGDLKAYEFARGVEEGFLYGKLNIGQEEMAQRGSYVNLLNPMQKNMAYKYGQFAGEKQTKQRQTEASERNAKRIRKGGVHYGYAGQTLDKSKLTKAQRVGVDFAERLAKKKGMTFYFYRSYVNSQGQRVYKDQKGQTVAADKNGWYDPSDGSIHIDLNCGDMGGTVLFTLAHS